MDLIDISRIVFALIAVLGMIGLTAFIARRAGLSGGGISLSKDKRLSVSETMAVDARRRVIIVKCDGREHLLLLGATGETVIASDIPAPEPSEAAAESAQKFGEAMQKLRGLGRGSNPFAERYAESKTVGTLADDAKDASAA